VLFGVGFPARVSSRVPCLLPPLASSLLACATGLDKTETVEKHGADQVLIWRRSYATPPPPMPDDHGKSPRLRRQGMRARAMARAMGRERGGGEEGGRQIEGESM